MLDIYLGRNTCRNEKLIAFFEEHGILYCCKGVEDLTSEVLFELFSRTSDCFEFLSPSLRRYKCHYGMKLSELIMLILRQPEQSLRLPLVIYQNTVYSDVTIEEARTFLPRSYKEALFRDNLRKNVTH